MTESEVAQLRYQITSEHEAAQRGIAEFACIASHYAITARMERAWQHLQALLAAGQEQEAQELLFNDPFYEADEEDSCSKNR